MPMKKPLKRGAPKKKKDARMAEDMHELTHGPVNAPSRKATSGKQRQKQNVAIALKNSGLGKKRKKK